MGHFLRRRRPKQRIKAAWGSADPRTGAAVLRRLCYALRGASCGEGAGGCLSSSRGAFWPPALPNVGRGCASEMSPGACWLCRLPKHSPQLPEGVEHHGAKVGPAGRLQSGGSGIKRERLDRASHAGVPHEIADFPVFRKRQCSCLQGQEWSVDAMIRLDGNGYIRDFSKNWAEIDFGRAIF